MAQETWLVVAVGAGFLLLGIAASPLAWVAILHRRANADREEELAPRLSKEDYAEYQRGRRAHEEAEQGGWRVEPVPPATPRRRHVHGLSITEPGPQWTTCLAPHRTADPYAGSSPSSRPYSSSCRC